jgi:hypothetical protein
MAAMLLDSHQSLGWLQHHQGRLLPHSVGISTTHLARKPQAKLHRLMGGPKMGLCDNFQDSMLRVGTDKTWIPDLPKGSDNYRFGRIRDTPIRLQIQRNEPCNLSTTNPLVINLAAARLTSPRRLTLVYESKNTSKCMEKQPNHRKQLIQLTSGVPQPKNGVLFLTEMN